MITGLTAKKNQISKEEAVQVIDKKTRATAINMAHTDLNTDRTTDITKCPMEVSYF